MEPIYYKAKRFFTTGEYETNSKIISRAEIVTYDIMLCPVLSEEAISFKFFSDISISPDEQIVAYYKNPMEGHEYHILDSSFEFCGYDLSEELTGISSITNCGGMFDKAIPYEELNNFGLISEYKKAIFIRDLLEKLYSDEGHAGCKIYELWRALTINY